MRIFFYSIMFWNAFSLISIPYSSWPIRSRDISRNLKSYSVADYFLINSLAPGRCGYDFKSINSEHEHIMD